MTTSATTVTTYRRGSPVGQLPILVGLLAILVGLFGLFFLVIGVLLLASSFGALTVPGILAFSPVGGGLLLAGAITLVFGAVLVSVASGLWDLETWALYLTGIVVVGIIAVQVLEASFGIALLVAVALLIYLVAVRNHFY
jgi:hypothetical protein